MANWCSNVILIKGPKEQIVGISNEMKRLVLELVGGDASLVENGCAVLSEEASDGCAAMWEVTEDVKAEELEEGQPYFFTGESRWSPLSEEGLCALSASYPGLRIRHEYEECGAGFAGVTIIEDGEVVENIHVEDDDFIYGIEDTIGILNEVNEMPIDEMPLLLADYTGNEEEYEDQGIEVDVVLKFIRARLSGETLDVESLPMVKMSKLE